MAQRERLNATPQGRSVLTRQRYPLTPQFCGDEAILMPPDLRTRTHVNPIPRHMNPHFHVKRREARAAILRKRQEDADTHFTDAGSYNRDCVNSRKKNEMAAVRAKPYFPIIDGKARCPFVTPESLSQALSFVAQKGDLLQVSYPRSGTHWVQYITQLILQEGRPIASYQHFMQQSRFIEYCVGATDEKSSTSVRNLCTHLPLLYEKLNPDAKSIISALTCFEDGTFDDFFEAFVTGELGYGCYFEHVTTGYSMKNEPNVFFLTYEELKNHTRDSVLRLARFIDDRYERMLVDINAEGRQPIECILERCQAESMKKVMVLDFSKHLDKKQEERFKTLNVTSKAGHEGDSRCHCMVRKGDVGAWKQYFSPDQLRRMEAAISEKTRGSDVMELWSDMRHEAKLLYQGTL
ncbi:hypothetical protein HPB49_025614 [Dermacentor silvarum]|uniref:Uncharacterized protein n=1 Tax=Dermacentor silvarum TaxID=543639 RepID=A0ACB8D9G9_DERSI|nr:hypothetical protein HPB49_025614 [Dermacentor silvarum]